VSQENILDDQKQAKKPIAFLIFTFIFTWGLWLPSILTGLGIDLGIDAETYTAITVPIGAFAPLLVALAFVIKQEGWQGGWHFFRQAFDLKVKPIYLIAAFLIPLIIHAISHYLAPRMGFPVADTLFPAISGLPSIIIAIPYFFLMLIIGGGQEEFGWRGYAQAPLQKRIGVIPASLLIGLVWGIWHLPLWVMPGDGHSTYPFIAFLIMTTSISIIYGWLYNASNQKLVTVIIFHAMSNTAAPLLPFLIMQEGTPENAYWVYAAINVLAAVLVGFVIIKAEKKTMLEAPA
jgi:membrane protease YdiL (CAAX protease family)